MSPQLLVWIFTVLTSCIQPALLTTANTFVQMQKHMKVEYFKECDEISYPIKFFSLSFARNGSLLVVNGEQIIERDIESPIKIKFLIEKCRDKSNPDTCEYYTTWKWDDACATFTLPFVKAFTDAYTPPLSCPVKKNHHYIQNARLSADMVSMFLTRGDSNVLWKFRVETAEDDQTVCCVDFGFRFVSVRVKA